MDPKSMLPPDPSVCPSSPEGLQPLSRDEASEVQGGYTRLPQSAFLQRLLDLFKTTGPTIPVQS